MADRKRDLSGGRPSIRLAPHIAAVAALALLPAACGGASESATATKPRNSDALPSAVAKTHAALLRAAGSDDYDQLRPLIAQPFEYTYSASVGGPIAYWQALERQGTRPLAILRDLLRLPHTVDGGVYAWPFAVGKQRGELTDKQRRRLRSVGGADLSGAFGRGSGYVGWRVGIDRTGKWVFFIAGD